MQAEAVPTHRVSAGHPDIEWLVVDAQCLLCDVVQRGRVVCKGTDLQASTPQAKDECMPTNGPPTRPWAPSMRADLGIWGGAKIKHVDYGS